MVTGPPFHLVLATSCQPARGLYRHR